MSIPNDPMILLSYINTQLRDFYPSLEEFGKTNNIDIQIIKEKLSGIGYEYNSSINRFVWFIIPQILRFFDWFKLIISNFSWKWIQNEKFKYKDFNMKSYGFVGYLAKIDEYADIAIIVIMGGEKSILPPAKIAERFAEYGMVGLAVSLYSADCLHKNVDRIPLDIFISAVSYIRNELNINKISIYGMSMGSLFAAMAAVNIGE